MLKPENKLHRLFRQQAIAFLVAAIVAGLMAIVLGFNIESTHPTYAKILVTIGSSGLGTCFGLAIGTITGSSAVYRIKELIESSLMSAISAEADSLAPLQATWHHYLRTSIDGKPTWRYRVLDFSRADPVGKLSTSLAVQGPDGSTHIYLIEGFIVPPRLILIQSPTIGTELPIVHVYPFATEQFRTVVAGIAFLQTWDGKFMQSPVLMSKSKLQIPNADYKEGQSVPDAAFTKLEELWGNESKAMGLLS